MLTTTSPKITASMLYDMVACEYRVWMDLYGDPAKRDAVSPFLDLMWRRGRAHEMESMATEGTGALNLRVLPVEQREAATLAAMQDNEPLIYGGRISVDDLMGEPDLLRLEDGKYVAGDIKSGAGEEGSTEEDKRPKKHYGVQLALYADVLERLGLSAGRRGFVWDIHGEEVAYDLAAPKGPRTTQSLWDDYQDCLRIAREIVAGVRNAGPAYSASTCRLCVWLSSCVAQLEAKDDLTLLPGLGRHMREPFLEHIATSKDLAATSPERFLDDKGKSVLRGVGPDSIAKFHARATLKTAGGLPYKKTVLDLPKAEVELFFDIETDPMRDNCYLHGFVERRNGDDSTERYYGFFSPNATPAGEREAFAAAWDYVRSVGKCVVYIFSKYERTWWRMLRQKYPDVCSQAEIEEFFADSSTVDLYQVVQSSTEWPTRDFSIKTLAQYLGFSWRDPHPSGAASIEWYDRYCSGEQSAKARILEYNEDDCRAMRVLLDGIHRLPVGV